MSGQREKLFRGEHCTLRIERPVAQVVLVRLEGNDIGEFADAPFKELAGDVEPPAAGRPDGQLELYIDARHGVGASLDVSSEWAIWLARHKPRFRHVSMLTGSRFIQLSASFVRRFAEMGELMRIYTDPAAFEGALASSIANARSASRSPGH